MFIGVGYPVASQGSILNSHVGAGGVPRPHGAVPLFNQSDIQLYKQQMYSNFVNNYSPVYTPNQMSAGLQSPGGAQGSRMPFAYTFLTGPGTANGHAITSPAHKPMPVASSIAAEKTTIIMQATNPYARPISAQDVIAPGTIMAPNGQLGCALNHGSNNSISSIGSGSASNTRYVTQQIATAKSQLQTNTFMRPQSAAVPNEANAANGAVVPQTMDQSRRTHHRVLSLQPHVSRPPSGRKPHHTPHEKPSSASRRTHADHAARSKPLAVSTSDSAANQGQKSPSASARGKSAAAEEKKMKSRSESSHRLDSATQQNGSPTGKHRDGVGHVVSTSSVHTNQRSGLNPGCGVSAKYGRTGVQNWVMNKSGSSSSSFKSTPNGTCSGSPSSRTADKPAPVPASITGTAIANHFVPRLPRPSSVNSSSSEASSIKVRNPNYTPSKPYSQVSMVGSCGGTDRDSGDDSQSDSARRTEAINQRISGGAGGNKRNVAFHSHAMEINPQMLLDGRVKEMPVTHTLTGALLLCVVFAARA